MNAENEQGNTPSKRKRAIGYTGHDKQQQQTGTGSKRVHINDSAIPESQALILTDSSQPSDPFPNANFDDLGMDFDPSTFDPFALDPFPPFSPTAVPTNPGAVPLPLILPTTEAPDPLPSTSTAVVLHPNPPKAAPTHVPATGAATPNPVAVAPLPALIAHLYADLNLHFAAIAMSLGAHLSRPVTTANVYSAWIMGKSRRELEESIERHRREVRGRTEGIEDGGARRAENGRKRGLGEVYWPEVGGSDELGYVRGWIARQSG
ncbi:hypothetical protein K461DRAFT_267139 [Myriangium duriaei CBS 260.36]|uniref:Uncharacterized protein n=1 Tax=Myriangium duriaei CBS 260.36 TaxID=1168546 RepID=A0A9P4J3G8_9PEZI|nr:hypothetical protein K461DRAFT_267139 [Myriangium duriaei CBS 260.36]